jgi:hypothetical protein
MDSGNHYKNLFTAETQTEHTALMVFLSIFLTTHICCAIMVKFSPLLTKEFFANTLQLKELYYFQPLPLRQRHK